MARTDGMVSMRITVDEETAWLLEWLCEQAHITARNRRSVLIQQLIHGQITKMKISDRPVYPGRENEDEGR